MTDAGKAFYIPMDFQPDLSTTSAALSLILEAN
jgi:hypothetical protein